MLRKKWLSLLVAVSMVAAMMPTTAFAADGDENGNAPGAVITDGTQDQGDTQGENQGDGQNDDQGDDQQDDTQGEGQGEDQQDDT